MRALLIVKDPLTTLEAYEGTGFLSAYVRFLGRISELADYDKVYLLTMDRRRYRFRGLRKVIHVPIKPPRLPRPLRVLYCYVFGTLKALSLARRSALVRADGGTIELHAVMAAKLARRPVFISLRYYEPYYSYGKGLASTLYASALSLIIKACLRHADKVIALTELLRRLAIRLGAKPANVITIPILMSERLLDPDAYDRDAIRAEKGLSGRVVLFVGRLAHEKKVDDLIRAFHEVARRLGDARLVLIGDGPGRRRLEELCSELGLEGRVLFTGAIPRREVLRYLAAADVFVLPSMMEGLPKALLEAMAMRKPIVASRAPGITEVVRHGREALLMKVGDVGGLAGAIQELLTNRELAEELASRAREMFERYYSYERLYPKLGPLMKKYIAVSFG
ncbi:hypothetical protein DRO33_00900 [Candidatus Bathyarchaeota archaeon]|nr:MAG: hypothetical protein DRO33_00900 [Candidatus Bathyarchaeota archaeon]